MNRKYWQIALIIVLLPVAYLLTAHYYIYHTIGVAALKATDDRHQYMFNSEMNSERGLVYVSLGDSLTAGVGTARYEESYPYLISQQLSGADRKVTHLNFSYPGARTEDLIRDLLAKAIAEQPNVVTLLIGTNDVHGNVSQSEFADNYRYILAELTKKTQAKINVISIPYIGSDDLLLPPYRSYYREKVNDFNAVIKELALDNKVNFIDLTNPTANLAAGSNGYYSADKFHPSNLGYKIWADIIYDHLNQ